MKHLFFMRNCSGLSREPTFPGLSAESRDPATSLDPADKPREVGRGRVVTIMLCLCISPVAWGINLFNDNLYRPFIIDRRAYLVGDVLTVIVLETSNAKTSADLSSSKDIKTALEANYNNDQQAVNFGLRGHGDATAKTERNGKIKASLTVRIKNLLPNASYTVEGHQNITINGEVQTIYLRGIVRQEDINAQNTVLSNRLADAQITYTGDGSVSNAQTHNHLYKLLSFLGLV